MVKISCPPPTFEDPRMMMRDHLAGLARLARLAWLALGALGWAACDAPPATRAASTVPAAPADRTPIPLAEARARLAEADALCTADHGALWGISLCGPVMLVDRETRFVVANQADQQGQLRAQAGVFVGTLPADQTIANTSVTWAGVHWMQAIWPLPADPGARSVLMMHELFHRIEDQLGITQANPDNPQLATAVGRYYLQLEWRALARALAASGDERRTAAADALAFRNARRAAFPGTAASEDALELNEGLAEYTGVVIGSRTPAARIAAAGRDLTAHVADPSFVRSFAYATGPGYGLLLDGYAPGWRQTIAHTRSLADALAHALPGPPSDAERAAATYGGPALRAAEQARATESAARLAPYRRTLVDGPVATLAFVKMKIQFDPGNVQPLDELGSVYPTLTVVDDWGTLHVTGGALIKADWSAVIVPAPVAPTALPLTGDGWRLDLAPGWHLVPDQRAGDVRLERTEPPH